MTRRHRSAAAILSSLVLTGAVAVIQGCGSQTNGTVAESPSLTSPPAQAEKLSPGEKANAEFTDNLSGQPLLAALKEGGHVIFFRHAATEKDYADQADPNMRLDDCETQRKLSKEGIRDARAIGAAFSRLKIPVGSIVTSDYCRSWKTADLAFGRHDRKNPNLNFLPFEDYTDAQVETMKQQMLPILSEMPASGTNSIIVGHDDLFEAATGIYPDPQGIAYVLKPDGNGRFVIIANLLPQEWNKLDS